MVEITKGEGRIDLVVDGRAMGQIVYRRLDDTIIIIDSTDIDPALKGQGLGRRLVEAVVALAREEGHRIRPDCPFARRVLEGDPAYADLLEPGA